MHSREECTVPLNNGCFTPVFFSAYGALLVDGSVWSSFADVEGEGVLEHPTLLDYFILVYLFIGGWWREDFAWWRVRWWRDRSLVASSLVASLPGGEVTGNLIIGFIFSWQ